MSYRSNQRGSGLQNNGSAFPINKKIAGNFDIDGVFTQINKQVDQIVQIPIVQTIKPYVPLIAHFLIVATFLEDSSRILSQWSEQVFYLHEWKRYPKFLVVIFLFVVTFAQVGGAILVLLRKHLTYATAVLVGCTVLQTVVYGFSTGSSFVLKNFSVIGGVLIGFSDSFVKNKVTFQMLPELNNKDEKTKSYFLLAGRILTIFMFLGFTFNKTWVTVILTMIFTVFFAIGYQTKIASFMLLLILNFYNLAYNSYWFYSESKRDFLRYEFFQNLSIIGALLLITNIGAGEISFDQKKKIY